MTKLDSEEKTNWTLNGVIDYLIEMNGLGWVINYLRNDMEWTEKDFQDMAFDMDDVARVFKEKDEET